MRYLNGGYPVGREDSDPDSAFLMPRGTEPHVWTARLRADDGFAGWLCLWPEAEHVAELGYRLRRDVWGRGLASEGAAALVTHGFTALGYQRITATTMAVNSASRRVLEKIGMAHLRTDFAVWPDPIPGSEQGDVWYEIAREDWLSRRA